MSKLSKVMSVTQFDNGYWYADEIKVFAKEIGVPSSGKLRKDELEIIIRHFLQTGEIKEPARKKLKKSGVKDTEKGLSLELPVIHYTSNRETKSFIMREALKKVPGLEPKSGVSYRLNRWREEQIDNGMKITYGDLVNQYIKLNQTEGSFEKIPSGRYINFVSEFLANEKDITREDATSAWEELKRLDIPKTYQAWKKFKKNDECM